MVRAYSRTGSLDSNQAMSDRCYGFRPAAKHKEILDKHRFEGELDQQLINRLIRRLRESVLMGDAPACPTYEKPDGPKLEKSISFYLEPANETFFQEVQSELFGDVRGAMVRTTELLLDWADLMEPITPIKTQEDALKKLAPFRDQRILVTDAMSCLQQYCSVAKVVELLNALADEGYIREIEHKKSGTPRVNLGDRKVSWIHVSKFDLRKPITT